MAARRPVAPAPQNDSFTVSAKVLFMSLLTAAIIAAAAWQFSTLNALSTEVTKLNVNQSAMNKQLEIFATKEALARVEQKLDTHIQDADRKWADRKR